MLGDHTHCQDCDIQNSHAVKVLEKSGIEMAELSPTSMFDESFR